MVNMAIINPFDFPRDSFQRETQTLRYRAAAGVFGGALDGDPVEFPDIKAVINHRAATSRHDTSSLVPGIQPIGQGCPMVRPINIQMVDHPAKLSFMPNAGVKPSIVCVLLLPAGDDPFTRQWRTNEIHPGMPAPDMLSVGIKKFE